jgi:ankyrin repeat protein
VKDKDGGYTALHRAVEEDHRPVVELLLARRASLSLKSDYGETALAIAERLGHVHLIKLLRK